MDSLITHTPYVTDGEFTDKIIELQKALESAKAEINSTQRNYEFWYDKAKDAERKIGNAGGVISDYYSENGELTDELKDIAKYLEIPLTKHVSGTATFEISWSAQVPLDFDPDDFEISFSAECESYDAEDFEWQEENSEVNGEDDY